MPTKDSNAARPTPSPKTYAKLNQVVKYAPEKLDRVFYALSDSTRRDMLGRVSKGPVAVTSLAQRYQMSLPAVVKHLGVLESCGLVKTDKVGRVRTCILDATPLQAADDWIETYRIFWEGQFDRLGEYLETLNEEEEIG